MDHPVEVAVADGFGDLGKREPSLSTHRPRVTAGGSRHVHFALEPPEIMDV